MCAATLHLSGPRTGGPAVESFVLGYVALRMTSVDTREPLPSEKGHDGSFRRREARFRDFVTADGSSGYEAESGR